MDTATISTSPFQVGDQVRLITPRHGNRPTNPVWGGTFSRVGKVISIFSNGYDPLPVRVQWGFAQENDYSVRDLAHHVEAPKPAPAKPAPDPGIWVGDRVFLKHSELCGVLVGATGTVASLTSSFEGQISVRFDGHVSGYHKSSAPALANTYAVKPKDLRYYADAGEGYRILRDNETRLPTDEVIGGNTDLQTWHSCKSLRLCSHAAQAKTVGDRRAELTKINPRAAWTLQYRRKEEAPAVAAPTPTPAAQTVTPRCSTLTPPAGFRILAEGEPIQLGDRTWTGAGWGISALREHTSKVAGFFYGDLTDVPWVRPAPRVCPTSDDCPAVQSYQFLGDNDVIQAGDEFRTNVSVDKWYRFGDSVGRTLAEAAAHLSDLDGVTIREARRPAPTPAVEPATTRTADLRNGGTITLDRNRTGLPLITVRYSDGQVASANRYTDDELTALATLLNQGTK